MRPQIYLQGETFNIGLRWTDLSKEPVDVSEVEEIKVSLVSEVFRKTAITLTKTGGDVTVAQDKCLITVTSEQTAQLRGSYYLLIEITFGGQAEKAIADRRILFIKPN